jgi:hypothetical protein
MVQLMAVAQPPAPTVAWVATTDGGHVQVSQIVRFVQETNEDCVMVWLADGKITRSMDAAFFPVPLLQQRRTTMTLGEYRVGITFNPSGDETVNKIKRAAADLIDLVDSIEGVDEAKRLKALAMTHIEDAAMWAVKAATKTKHD